MYKSILSLKFLSKFIKKQSEHDSIYVVHSLDSLKFVSSIIELSLKLEPKCCLLSALHLTPPQPLPPPSGFARVAQIVGLSLSLCHFGRSTAQPPISVTGIIS